MKYNDFLRGGLTFMAIMSLWQDIAYGSAQAYSDYILHGGWINRSISIPIALVALILVVITGKRGKSGGEK